MGKPASTGAKLKRVGVGFAAAALLVAVVIVALVRLNPGLPFAEVFAEGSVEDVVLPEGFSIAVFADDVPGARSLAVGSDGTLYVGSRGPGNVYALRDEDGDGSAENTVTLLEGLNSPNGVALRDGDLYVAEIDRILRFDDIADHPRDPPEPTVVYDEYPSEAQHGWKFIAFGPDGKLYVPVGAPCNACEVDDPFAAITRMDPDGTDFEIFARGVRNTVGFDFHPETGDLWFTDNGRDWLGDDEPPDELNRAAEPGMHFGFPFCWGDGRADPDFGGDTACDEFVPPEQTLGPHVAALGMRFYSGTMFPEEYRNQIFIAEHGSWNRTDPIGYRVTLVRLEDGRANSYEPFAEGWLQGRTAWGRPVDVAVAPDGALYVSDDRNGVVYRISYTG